MRRTLLSWVLVFALLAAGFGASVLALNGDVFSAHGFVRSYLDTLARKDAVEALAFAGVVAPAGESTLLLQDAALSDLGDIHFLRESETAGVHRVVFSYTLGSEKQLSEFSVERVGTRLGFFATWRFVTSPLATVEVTVRHDSRFTVNGLAASGDGRYAVFAPGQYELGHNTKYLAAKTVALSVTEPGSTVPGEVDVEANDAFTTATTRAVHDFLDRCATQKILMPTGCPFGFDEVNRLDGVPAWSMVKYPTVTLQPSKDRGVWIAESTKSSATIRAVVRSLFDGSTSKVTEDVRFQAIYLVAIGADNSLSVSARL